MNTLIQVDSSYDDGIAVRVANVSKCYQLWRAPEDRLKQPLRSMVARWFPIGEKKYFKDFWALRDISFEVRRGESLGIIGRNGSGKSTLLQIVCGILAPTMGTVTLSGRVRALLELGSGFNPEFTGRDNVYMNGSILGFSRREIERKYQDIVDFADIGDFIDQPVKLYSSGMFVRLAFATAFHLEPEVLVIDEALAVGDVFFNQKCMRLLRGFRERGTLLFVSHDTGAVVSLCDRAIMLEGGAVVADGSPKDVCDLYLKTLFAAEQAVERPNGPLLDRVEETEAPEADQRQRFINSTQYRNDIELFRFNPSATSFGEGGATIVDAKFLDAESRVPLSYVVGGERVTLVVRCLAHRRLSFVVIGFYVRDWLGQNLFGDNNLLAYADRPFGISEGKYAEATFTFQMPILQLGDHSVTVAIAEYKLGNDYLVHHWIHDAIVFKSHSTSNCTGLVGIPMEKITIQEIQCLEG